MTRKGYNEKFKSYPDVVNLVTFRKMLGGIGQETALKLMQNNHVKHFYIETTYLIPKEYVVDYVLSKHYKKYKKRLRVRV